MFDKKLTTLAEDFQALGLIRKPAISQSAPAPAKKLSESKNLEFAKKAALQKKIVEQKKAKMIEEKKKELLAKKIAEQKKLTAQKARATQLESLKQARLKKLKEAQRKVNPAAKKQESTTSDVLKNLMNLEQRLNQQVSVKELLRAFENVTKVSELAMRKVKRLSEEDAVDYNTDQASAGDVAGDEVPAEYKDMLEPKEGEGEVSYDDKDEQDTGADMGVVDTTTELQAGEPGYQDPEANELDLMGEEEEVPTADDDELNAENEDPEMTEEDEMNPEEDDTELNLEDDEINLDDEVGMNDQGLPDDTDLDLDLDLDPSMGGEEGSDDLDSCSCDDNDLGDLELDVPDEDILDMSDDEVPGEPLPQESVRASRADYIAELRDIRVEAEEVMAKIRKHAISPSDAESVLKDIVARLGGAVGDVADMSKYASSEKETALESKKGKKK